MDINKLIDDLSKSENKINVSDKLTKLLDLYKKISLKYVLTAEKTLFKICKKENKIKNLISESSIHIINDFLHGIFSYCWLYEEDNDSKKIFKKIICLTNESKKIILNKVFKIVDAFYSIINRSEIKDKFLHNDYEYSKYFILKYNDYLQAYYELILDLINSNDFNENLEFKLTCIE